MIIYLIVDSTKLTVVEYTDFWIRLPMLLTLCWLPSLPPPLCQIFIGRIGAEAETPVLWSPDAKN